MKKNYFFREYPIHGSTSLRKSFMVQTIEVDFNDIEKELPPGASIKHDTVQTVIEGGNFIVYGEYYTLTTALNENVAHESLDVDELLGDQDILPSIN